MGKKHFPELEEVIEIRDILMGVAKNIIPSDHQKYEHEGSGAGLGAADFRFYLDGKYYKVEVEEIV